jgi:electron transfer flavoprotein alpha subunit
MILGLIEHDRGQLNPQSLEMLTLARGLAKGTGKTLTAVLLGKEAEAIVPELGPYGVEKVFLVSHNDLTDYAPMAWAESIVQLANTHQPEAILASGTDRGNEVMAHVAARLGNALAANCIEVQPGDDYLLTRIRWGSSLLEEARLSGSPKLLTVAPLVITAEPVAEPAEAVKSVAEPVEAVEAGEPVAELVEAFTPTLDPKDLIVQIKERVQPEGDKISLAEAKVVVSGGRGVGSAENFAILAQ